MFNISYVQKVNEFFISQEKVHEIIEEIVSGYSCISSMRYLPAPKISFIPKNVLIRFTSMSFTNMVHHLKI